MPQWQLLRRMHNLLDHGVKNCFPALQACVCADIAIAVSSFSNLAALPQVWPDRANGDKSLMVVLPGSACDVSKRSAVLAAVKLAESVLWLELQPVCPCTGMVWLLSNHHQDGSVTNPR